MNKLKSENFMSGIQDIVSFDCANLFKKNRNNPSREFIL